MVSVKASCTVQVDVGRWLLCMCILILYVHFVCMCCVSTYDVSGVSAIDVLRKGLEDLQTLCDHILDTFQVSKLLP